MGEKTGQGDRKGILVLSGLAALVGGLCCLTPVVLVLLGLASISAAASLGNVLYGDYHWEFRLVALALLGWPWWSISAARGSARSTKPVAKGTGSSIRRSWF